MRLTDICLHRPVTTLMFFVALILLGIISLSFLPQELFPPLSYPQITIFTTYREASPQEIETLITRPTEESVGTVNGLKRVSSISKEGASIVMAEFDWKTNMDFASLEVREKLDIIKERFPKEADEPLVMKYNPFQTPMMRVNVTGEEDPLILKRIAKKDIKESLEKIEGIGSIEIVGGTDREIRIEVSETKLRSVSLSILDVVGALQRSNINYPAGTIKEPFFEFNIRTVGEFENVAEIATLPIKAELPFSDETPFLKQIQEEKAKEEQVTLPENERLVALGDIAHISDTSELRTSISRFQEKESVSLLIRKQSGVNTVKVTRLVRDELKAIQAKLPQGLHLKVVHDESLFIKDALSEVRNAALLGGVFAFIVIFFFLRSWIYSFIVIISIPLSIIIVFLCMHLFGLSLNLISLGGLALGAGMLVDNCIVVLESIFINQNEDLKKKVIQGTQEVSVAIFSSTLTTICVFLPMIFITGIAGQIFKHLSFSIVFSLIASLFVSLTILPLLVYFALKKQNISATEEIKIENWDNIFNACFRKKHLISFLVLIAFLLSCVSFTFIPKELFPKIDQHAFTLKVEAPPGTPLYKTDRFVREIEDILLHTPSVEEVTVNIGSSSGDAEQSIIQSQGAHQGQIFVSLDKQSSTSMIIKTLEQRLSFLDGEDIIITFVAEQGLLKEAFIQQAPVVLEVKGYSMDVLQNIANVVQQKLKSLPALYNVKTDFPPSRPEIKINVKKDVALLSHISTDQIARTLNTSIKGNVATTFKEKGEEYPIRVILQRQDRESINKIKHLIIHGVYQDRGVNVPLIQVADIVQGSGPLEIKRVEGQRTIIVTADLFKSSLGDALTQIEETLKEIPLPDGYRVVIGGEGQKMDESFLSLVFALALAILMVFMVMASSFESLWQPFIILFTIPLSLIGVVLLMLLSNTSLNAISFLGLIMLGGIIVNNGIVLVDYINLLIREKHIPLEDALRLGSERRVRPILMTSLTTIMGLIPLSIQASLMSPLGRVTMGGLVSATFLTPIIIPFLYYYFYRIFAWVGNIFDGIKEKWQARQQLKQMAAQSEAIDGELEEKPIMDTHSAEDIEKPISSQNHETLPPISDEEIAEFKMKLEELSQKKPPHRGEPSEEVIDESPPNIPIPEQPKEETPRQEKEKIKPEPASEKPQENTPQPEQEHISKPEQFKKEKPEEEIPEKNSQSPLEEKPEEKNPEKEGKKEPEFRFKIIVPHDEKEKPRVIKPEEETLQEAKDEKSQPEGEAKQKAAEEEAQRKAAEEEAQRKAAEEEAQRKAAEEEAQRKAAEEEAQRKAAEEEAQRKAAEEEAQRKAAEEEAKRKAAEEEAKRKAAEEEAKQKTAEEETQRKAAEEEAQRKASEEEATRKAAEEEAKRKAAEEEATRKAAEEEAKRK
ncbi:MAG: efflux RND transporter permease subunit, partial [Candidatus Omnitrophica bacterium]|nr:efflux RND transporter permease subunit [Candidatus Omnitrophota bacterium]